MKDFYKNNILFHTYSFLLFLLFIGVYYYSQLTYFPQLLVFFGSFTATYFLVLKINPFRKLFSSNLLNLKAIESSSISKWALLAFVAFIIIHYSILNEIPIISAIQSDDDIQISLIRQRITEQHSLFLNYLSSFIIMVFYLSSFFTPILIKTNFPFGGLFFWEAFMQSP